MKEFLVALGVLIKVIVDALRKHWATEEHAAKEEERAELAKKPGEWFDNHFGPDELPRRDSDK